MPRLLRERPGPGAGKHLKQSESLTLALRELPCLKPHDRRWAAQFLRERQRIEARLPGRFAEIRHIGSTAVPDLMAKPVIDIIVGLADFGSLSAALADLCRLGYVYDPDAVAQSPDRRWLFRHREGRRTFHVHVVSHQSSAWIERVAFCERLKHDPVLRVDYQALKLRLLESDGSNREAYTAAKEPFIRSAIQSLCPPMDGAHNALSLASWIGLLGERAALSRSRRRGDTGVPASPERSRLLEMRLLRCAGRASSCALASGNLAPSHWQARQFLIRRADRELGERSSILSEMHSIGQSPPPLDVLPSAPAGAAFVAYEFYVAVRNPLAILVIVAAQRAVDSALREVFSRPPANRRHRDAARAGIPIGEVGCEDAAMEDPCRMLTGCELSHAQWLEMEATASTAVALYMRMVEETVFQ